MCGFLFPINCHDKHISLIIPRIMGMPFSSARAQLLEGKTLRPSSEPSTDRNTYSFETDVQKAAKESGL